MIDSIATCHITSQVLGYIPDSLEDTDKHIEVADGHHFTEKQKGQFQIKMNGDNGDTFTATLHNKLLAPYLCDGLSLIIKLLDSGQTCLFQKDFSTLYFW